MQKQFAFKYYGQYLYQDRYGETKLTGSIDEAELFYTEQELIDWFENRHDFTNLNLNGPLELITFVWT